MEINLMEQRELADYIARILFQDGITSRKIQPPEASRKEIACTVWDAIEDYTGTAENAPDVLTLAKARIEGDQASDPDDFRDNYFTRDR